MKNSLFFYDVDNEYINYLKQFDEKIPNLNYDKNNKFVCGIVLSINNCDYYAPISSNKNIFKTSFPIFDKDKVVSTIRFSFMFPIPKNCCSIKDFKKEDILYRRLLHKELVYCRKHINQINKKAIFVYDSVVNRHKPNMMKNCCDFKLLEQAYLEYCKVNNLSLPETTFNKPTEEKAFYYLRVTSDEASQLRQQGIKFEGKISSSGKSVIRLQQSDTPQTKQILKNLRNENKLHKK